MELLEYWKIIRKRLWLIILLMVVAGVGAGFYSYLQPPQYQTRTTLFLNPTAARTVLQPNASVEFLGNTYSEFMRTSSFARAVAERLEYPLTEREILEAISTGLLRNTQFFRITAVHTDPAVAQALANTAAEVLIAENIARQQAERAQAIAQSDPEREAQRQRAVELQTTLQNELAYYEYQIAAIQEEIATLERGPQSDATDRELVELRGELVRLQGARLQVLTSLTEAQATLASASVSVPNVDTAVVVDTAPLPTKPLPSKMLQYVLMAVMAAAGIGVGLAFLLEYLDYTVKSPEVLDAIYGIPVQGVIGVAQKPVRSKADLPMISESLSPIAEAFRALRTGVQAAAVTEPIQSLLVTSAGPGEGKSFVAANLAISLAQNGFEVILADTDLRKPNLHQLFDCPREPGFTNLVIDPEASLAECLVPTGTENLWLLPCGPIPPNPAELLGSRRAAEVMGELSARADVVIYDSPPAATVTDAVVLATQADAVLHVVQAGATRIDVVLRCKAVLEQVGARILGPVLNRVTMDDLGYYSYYYSYGYYHNGHDKPKQTVAGRLLPTRKKSKVEG